MDFTSEIGKTSIKGERFCLCLGFKGMPIPFWLTLWFKEEGEREWKYGHLSTRETGIHGLGMTSSSHPCHKRISCLLSPVAHLVIERCWILVLVLQHYEFSGHGIRKGLNLKILDSNNLHARRWDKGQLLTTFREGDDHGSVFVQFHLP